MPIAITRAVSPSISQCELTHLARDPIDYDRAVAQHADYERALERAGCELYRLPLEPDMPDSVFVEDTAIVFDDFAIMTRSGAYARRTELAGVANALSQWRQIERIEPPGLLDGGDVVQIDDTVFVGDSTRSNAAAVKQLQEIITDYGYRVLPAPVRDCLHLKSAVTRIGPDSLLINPAWTDVSIFSRWKLIEIDPAESFAANAVWAGEKVIYPSDFPHTRERLEAAGIDVLPVPATELAKAEGGVSCCSLIFNAISPV